MGSCTLLKWERRPSTPRPSEKYCLPLAATAALPVVSTVEADNNPNRSPGDRLHVTVNPSTNPQQPTPPATNGNSPPNGQNTPGRNRVQTPNPTNQQQPTPPVTNGNPSPNNAQNTPGVNSPQGGQPLGGLLPSLLNPALDLLGVSKSPLENAVNSIAPGPRKCY